MNQSNSVGVRKHDPVFDIWSHNYVPSPRLTHLAQRFEQTKSYMHVACKSCLPFVIFLANGDLQTTKYTLYHHSTPLDCTLFMKENVVPTKSDLDLGNHPSNAL